MDITGKGLWPDMVCGGCGGEAKPDRRAMVVIKDPDDGQELFCVEVPLCRDCDQNWDRSKEMHVIPMLRKRWRKMRGELDFQFRLVGVAIPPLNYFEIEVRHGQEN